MKISFPKDFWWGAATASEQAEGHGETGKGQTKWDLHFQAAPDDFFDKVGPQVTSDFINHYQSDLKMFKNIAGINSIRLGFSWARLFPDGKTLNPKAVDYYLDLLQVAKQQNLKVVMTLFHFDMPAWAITIGGWSNLAVVDAYVSYCEFVFKTFDHLVDCFVTMNEPVVPIFGGYFGQKFHWPKLNDFQLGFNVGNRMILAHARVVNLFNQQPRQAKIGVVINVSPTHPRDEHDPEDVKAAQSMHLIHNLWMLDPMINGTFPDGLSEIFAKLGAKEFILTTSELHEIAQVKLDFIGTNFYSPTRLKKYEGEAIKTPLDKIAQVWKDPKARMNVHRGWEIYPQDIYYTAKLIQERYHNIPFFISENGMGVQDEDRFRGANGEIQDDYRIAFVQEHLHWCAKAIAEGANLFGYHMWAIFDCWSWVNAYKNRYGFFEVDLATQRRIPKKSAHWFKSVVEANGFDDQYVKLDEIKN